MKRLAVIVSVLLLCTLLTIGAVLYALRSARVQTAAVSLLTQEVSSALGVDAHIGRVDIDFPLGLVLTDFYCSDKQGDTLLSVPALKVRFNPFALEHNQLAFPLIEVQQPYIHFVQDSASTNLDFLVRAFRSPHPKPFTYGVECRKIILSDARVRYEHLPTGTDIRLSEVSANLGFRYAGKDSLTSALRSLHVKAAIPSMDGCVEGDFHGSLDTLYADEVVVTYHNRQLFQGNVRVDSPLLRDSMTVHLACNDLYGNAPLISSLLADILKRPVPLPDIVPSLGDIHYRGQVDGRMDDLWLHGAFATRVGTLTTDARVTDMQHVTGKLSTRHVSLGRLLNQLSLGHLSSCLTVDITLPGQQPFRARVEGSVSALEWKGYCYSSLNLQGSISSDSIDAVVYSKDPNIDFELRAKACMQEPVPSLQAQWNVHQCRLAALHLTDTVSDYAISFGSTIRLQADAPRQALVDRLTGGIRMDSLRLSSTYGQLVIPQLCLTVQSSETDHSVQLFSPLLTAEVKGRFDWVTLPATIKSAIGQTAPSVAGKVALNRSPNDLDMSVYLLHTDDLLDVLAPNRITLPTAQTIRGFVHESDSLYALQVVIPSIQTGKTDYQNITFALDNNNADRSMQGLLSATSHPMVLDRRVRIEDVKAVMALSARNDSLVTTFNWGTPDSIDSEPDLVLESAFSRRLGQPVADIHILPSRFYLGRELWNMADARVCYVACDTSLRIDGFHLFSAKQSITIDGLVSPRSNDSVRVELQDIDLGYLLSATDINQSIDMQGLLSGWATLYGIFSTPRFEANLSMPHAVINGADLGHLAVQAQLEPSTGNVLIGGQAMRQDTTVAHITGRVVPRPIYWELFIDANGLPLHFINRWTNGILQDLEGEAHGMVHIFGRRRATWVTARSYVDHAALTIPATGCRYFFSDSIVLDTASISFPHVRIRDAKGNTGIVTGQITHERFTQMRYQINVDCNHLMAIDLPADPQRIYYGKAFATGKVDIHGGEGTTSIHVNATTDDETDFYLSIATASSASSTDFISFASSQPTVTAQRDSVAIQQPSSHLLLNLSLDVQPSARVHLVLDPHNGDGIVGRGEGALRLTMDASTGALQLLGSYELVNGIFSYTIGNIIHRDFSIAEGSTVTWSGNPTSPRLNITAKYRCTASLRDLFGAEVKNITNRPSIPVDVVAHISGSLSDMLLRFGIEFPQSDESVAAQIYAVINTESMLMRQVAYLLMLNKFFTPDYLRSSPTGVGNGEAYSLLSSAVTGQINSWLSKLTSMVNVGFNMRTEGDGTQQSYETEANIQIQPIPRLTINGNVGYRYNDMTNRPVFGDADVEYELTPDGKLRATVYTHSVDKYSLRQSSMQEGIGFIFRHDFNPGDAKRKREQRKQSSKE